MDELHPCDDPRVMNFERNYTFDLPLRLCHGLIALSCLLLILTAWTTQIEFELGLYQKALWVTHIFSGYLLIFSLGLRIAWAVRLSQKPRDSSWGHPPQAALAYVILYLILLGLSLTGILLAAIEHNMGPLANMFFDEMGLQEIALLIHNILHYGVILFIGVHLIAMTYHERQEGLPIAQGMISGYQYRNFKKGDPQ